MSNRKERNKKKFGDWFFGRQRKRIEKLFSKVDLSPEGITFENMEKKCNGSHCRCMNLNGQCPNMHPSECAEHCPELVKKSGVWPEKMDELCLKENENLNHTHDSIDWENQIEELVQWESPEHEKEVKDFMRNLLVLYKAEGVREAMQSLPAEIIIHDYMSSHNTPYNRGWNNYRSRAMESMVALITPKE